MKKREMIKCKCGANSLSGVCYHCFAHQKEGAAEEARIRMKNLIEVKVKVGKKKKEKSERSGKAKEKEWSQRQAEKK